MSTGQDIINLFETFVDDATELSSSDELILVNKYYKKICRNRPWEFLKKEETGNLSTSVAYVALPSDFAIPTLDRTVFVTINGVVTEYKIINYADRRDYTDQSGYCYIDLANSRLTFTLQPTSAYSYSFDYIYIPDDLTTATEPVGPSDIMTPAIYHAMCTDHAIIEMSDKARSYSSENQAKHNSYMRDLAYYNSQLTEDTF